MTGSRSRASSSSATPVRILNPPDGARVLIKNATGVAEVDVTLTSEAFGGKGTRR